LYGSRRWWWWPVTMTRLKRPLTAANGHYQWLKTVFLQSSCRSLETRRTSLWQPLLSSVKDCGSATTSAGRLLQFQSTLIVCCPITCCAYCGSATVGNQFALSVTWFCQCTLMRAYSIRHVQVRLRVQGHSGFKVSSIFFSLALFCDRPVWCMPSKMVNGLRVTSPTQHNDCAISAFVKHQVPTHVTASSISMVLGLGVPTWGAPSLLRLIQIPSVDA
jgi:hypothetical protein